MELYKKYAPKTWGEIVGQEHITNDIKKAVAGNRVPTAYGFIGGHGTGKTSTARVLAKALTCEKPLGDGDPCNMCTACTACDENTNIDVVYESMANVGGVDNVRELMRAFETQPHGRYRVLILDEVHNLSKQAFDSMLVPLERNTHNVVAVLCSTEPRKIPKTIMSRIQTRVFKPVSKPIMMKHMENIVAKEHLNVDHDTIEHIVATGKGSVRDTLTALDAYVSGGSHNSATNATMVANSVIKTFFVDSDPQHRMATMLKTVDKWDGGDLELAVALFTTARKMIIKLETNNRKNFGQYDNAYPVIETIMMIMGGVATNMETASITTTLPQGIIIPHALATISKQHPPTENN